MKYFEDIEIGDSETVGDYEITEEEIVKFSNQWDPLPIHVYIEVAARSTRGGYIASGQLTLAIKQKLYTQTEFIGGTVIGAIGWVDLRFNHPVRPGHRLSLTFKCIDKRASSSRTDRGLIKYHVTMVTQHDETILSCIGLVMVRKRQRE